jgi:hypothetical protein
MSKKKKKNRSDRQVNRPCRPASADETQAPVNALDPYHMEAAGVRAVDDWSFNERLNRGLAMIGRG